MQIEFLGSGGAITTPRPGCDCRLCVEAKAKGVPYSRGGPSVFIHGPNVLIDTPEEIKAALLRSRVTRIDAALYSHWHPDHVAGMRVWETMNGDWLNWPPHHRCTDIYLPQQVAQDFRHRLGAWEQFMYLQQFGVVRVVELVDGEAVALNGVRIRPFRPAEDYVYAFIFESGAARVLIAPDELYGWDPPADVRGADLAVIPMGLTEFDPFTGQRFIPADHPVLESEATFAQTLDIVRKLDARRVIMTHIEEPVQLSYDDLLRLEARLKDDGFNITFAYDTLLVEV
jgi:phosphoribosyl 1,2-cyclic phosphate phosphodiesterase